jgi:hypothetical protein
MDCSDGDEEVPWTSMSNSINASSMAPLAVVACRRRRPHSCGVSVPPNRGRLVLDHSGLLRPVIDVCGKHDGASTAICCCSVACGISLSSEDSMCSAESAPFLQHLLFPDNALISSLEWPPFQGPRRTYE